MTTFLIVSGIIFWSILGIIGLYGLYDDIDTDYFIWKQKYDWNKHLKKMIGEENL